MTPMGREKLLNERLFDLKKELDTLNSTGVFEINLV